MTYKNLITTEKVLRLLLRDGMIAEDSRGAVSDLCIDLDFRASLISHERENPDDGLEGVADAYALLGLEDDPDLIEFRRRMALPRRGRRPARK